MTDTTETLTLMRQALIPESRRADMHFENNSALREYLLDLADQLLCKAMARQPLPNDPHFAEEAGISRGITLAAIFLIEEVSGLRQASIEEYSS